MTRILGAVALVAMACGGLTAVAAAELAPRELAAALDKVRSVGPKGAGHREAAAAMKTLASADAEQLPEILQAMRGTNDLAANWLRGAVESVAQRSLQNGQKLPTAGLERFLADTSQSPRARRLAFELIASVDESARNRLIPTFLDDPSLELRRDAVAAQLERAEKLKADTPAAVAAYRKAFEAARDLDQIKAAAKGLKDLGESPDIARQMGFVSTWKLIGPFDNRGDAGWDTAYPPEKQVDFTAEHDGQQGKVGWAEHTTEDPFGVVDLNQALGKHKGAVAYAAAEVDVAGARTVEVRLGSVNAVKVFVNGQPIDERHVYHSGSEIDQYVSRAELKPGKNIILVKICQNEQTDSWAAAWQFQLRVCDEIGTAVRSDL